MDRKMRLSNIRSLTLPEIEDWVRRHGFDAYRANQLAGWFYNRPPTAVDEMHNLPGAVVDALKEDFDCYLPAVALARTSNDGTSKILVELADERVVESVIIPRGERITLCISSQVGCAMDCDFCATAKLGLARNLEPFEIVTQVMHARLQAAPHPLTNFVFMGMGEPLANYDRLLRSIELMTAKWGLGISPRRITVSTVGLVPALKRLAEDTSVNVAVSLTAANDALRDRLMPVNKRYPLKELIGACRVLGLPRRKRVTFEYVMLDGINDSLADADDLIRLLHGVAVKVNLIPFNSFEDCPYRCSSAEQIDAFQVRLLKAGVHATVRKSRGRDIEAACGQLAARAA